MMAIFIFVTKTLVMQVEVAAFICIVGGWLQPTCYKPFLFLFYFIVLTGNSKLNIYSLGQHFKDLTKIFPWKPEILS